MLFEFGTKRQRSAPKIAEIGSGVLKTWAAGRTGPAWWPGFWHTL